MTGAVVPIITIAGVSKRFGPVAVLDNVDLAVAAGETVVICGPSGSGKSTLLRCVNGLETIDEGRISVRDRIVDRNSLRDHEFRSQMGMVFQKFSLYPHKRVLENVTLALRRVRRLSRDDADIRAREVLAWVGVAELEQRYPATLSGGQQQRVAIARALALDPAILLLDEPTSALDPERVREVLDVLRRLARRGITLAIVTHEMGFAREVADRVVFMDDGRIVESAPAKSFFEAPQSERARQFLDQILHH